MRARDRLLLMLSTILSTLLVISCVVAYVLGVEVSYWRIVTILGDEVFYVGVLPLIYHGIDRVLGIELMVLISTTVWLGGTLKNVLKLPRPPRAQWLVEASGYAFPSGHALGSTTFWGYVALRCRSLVPLAIVLISLISYSRIVLRVHYLRDVVGGVAIGATVLILATVLKKFIERQVEIRKLVITLLSALILLTISYILGTLDNIAYTATGVLIGGATGHILLQKTVNTRKLSNVERITGSVLGLLVGYIGYKLSNYLPENYLLLPHYTAVTFTMIYGVGYVASKLTKYLEISR